MKTIKKTDFDNIKDIYALLGVSWQTVYKWRENLVSTHEGLLKRNFIEKAGCLFSLSLDEKERLANKAGLSLYEFKIAGKRNHENGLLECSNADKYQNSEFSTEIFPYNSNSKADTQNLYKQKNVQNINFSGHIKSLIATYTGKQLELYRAASMTDRMFRYIKSGQHLKKESILTLLIVMDLELSDIQIALKKAGFVLTDSLITDAVIIWMLNNDALNLKGEERLWCVNYTLEALSLPLLVKEPRD